MSFVIHDDPGASVVTKVTRSLVFGTPLLRIDLVNPDFIPHNSGGSAHVPTIGSILEFNYLARNNEVSRRKEGALRLISWLFAGSRRQLEQNHCVAEAHICQ